MAKGETKNAGGSNAEIYRLSKSFDMLRPYLREFYVNGFNDKSEMPVKGGSAYTDVLRRIDTARTEDDVLVNHGKGHKKVYYLPIDSRDGRHNPLFPFWRLSTFTDDQLLLHFLLLDQLYTPEAESTDDPDRPRTPAVEKSSRELSIALYDICNSDQDHIQKELERLSGIGILNRRMDNAHRALYSRAPDVSLTGWEHALDFFSEIAPCGVAASLMPGWDNEAESLFRFKHHYITSVLDSEVLSVLFHAVRNRYSVILKNVPQYAAKDETETLHILPLKLYFSVQTGRQYVMGWDMDVGLIRTLRVDKIASCTLCTPQPELFDARRAELDGKAPYLFGVSSPHKTQPLTVTFTIEAGEKERFIVSRLEREKRQGSVTRLPSEDGSVGLWRYEAQVLDEMEMIPWIRTFIGRLREVRFSLPETQARFMGSLNETLALYEQEDGTAVV